MLKLKYCKHRQTPESKFTKFGEEMSISQTHNHAKFLCQSIEKCLRYLPSKICAPKKVGQNSPKSLKICYPLKPPIIKIGKTTLEKRIRNFSHPSIFWLLRGYLRYLLPNFVDFVAGITHKTTKNSKQYTTTITNKVLPHTCTWAELGL